jgi:sulfite reductase (ferredoxin)
VKRIVDDREQRGFQVYLGGGLGSTPHLAQRYAEFLPAGEIFNLTAAVLRLFDRYGERKARMKARMKFLIQSMGWEEFLDALAKERERIGPTPFADELQERYEKKPTRPKSTSLKVLQQVSRDPQFEVWVRDSVVQHKHEAFRGVHVRLKLGDITSTRGRQLAQVARQFSISQLRVSIGQNIYLPWVDVEKLQDLYLALRQIELGASGVNTVQDVTTCPGSDTCRLGIASAKGLGSAISDAFNGPLAQYRELARDLRIKISGCPNGCAQHTVANIGFHAAAMSHDGRTMPAHLLSLGGQTDPQSAQFAQLIGKFPAKNSIKVIETLLRLYQQGKHTYEDFNSFVERTGEDSLRTALEPLQAVPSLQSIHPSMKIMATRMSALPCVPELKANAPVRPLPRPCRTLKSPASGWPRPKRSCITRNTSMCSARLTRLLLPRHVFRCTSVWWIHLLQMRHCGNSRTCLC